MPFSANRLEHDAIVAAVRKRSTPLQTAADLHPLLDRIGDARIVMLGEASHGTHEYYTWRAAITKRLVEEKGFTFIAVEGDWPDCYRLNRYVKHYPGAGETVQEALSGFDRWPTWMWANWEIVALADWLYRHNGARAANQRVGFYGLDVYSLWESLDSVVDYLQRVDPQALAVAHEAFSCFEPYRHDEGQSYARASQFVPEICQDEVVALLREIQNRLPRYNTDHENVFSAEQNALIAVNAETYYRTMIRGGASSWNVRDQHMADTLERLLAFHGHAAKAIVWEHNTHIGDARYTDMAGDGLFNLGQLGREKYGDGDVVLVGFGSYAGTVVAGSSWGAPMERKTVPPGRKNSWEDLCHRAAPDNKLMIMNDFRDTKLAERSIDHRAIGVVYNPQFERYGNYVPSVLARRYDAFLYIDETHALHPLHAEPEGTMMPETFPFGV